MLFDQEVTERVTKRPQTGACLHCHASIIPTYRRLGLQAAGKDVDTQSLASDFNWPAVLEGFKIAGAMDYSAAHAELLKTPDGSPGADNPLFPRTALQRRTLNQQSSAADAAMPSQAAEAGHELGEAHPVSCIDCHDPKTMQSPRHAAWVCPWNRRLGSER